MKNYMKPRPTSDITVNNYDDGLRAALNFFAENFGDNENMSTHECFSEVRYIGGIRRETKIFENYIDSGSVDYYYFEIETEVDAE